MMGTRFGMYQQTSFDPASLPGYFAEYSALNPNADGTLPANDDPIQTWKDLGPNGYDFTNATGAQQPLFKTNYFNGKPAINFTNTKTLIGPLAFLTNLSSGTFTIYIAMKSITLTDSVPLVAIADDLANRFNLIVPVFSNLNVYMDYGDAGNGKRINVLESDIYTGAPFIHGFQANTPALSLFRNNTTIGTNNNCGTFNPSGKLPHMGGGSSLDSYFFHYLCYNAAHDSGERALAFGYLNGIWGMY